MNYSSMQTTHSYRLRIKTYTWIPNPKAHIQLGIWFVAPSALNVWWYGYIFNIYRPDHEGKWVIPDRTPRGKHWRTGKRWKHGLARVCGWVSVCFSNVWSLSYILVISIWMVVCTQECITYKISDKISYIAATKNYFHHWFICWLFFRKTAWSFIL